MRLVSCSTSSGSAWGFMIGDSAILQEKMGANAPDSLSGLLDITDDRETLLADLLSCASEAPTTPVDQLSLLPCVPAPGKVICLGVNYINHANEVGNKIGDYPAIFLRCSSSLLSRKAPLRVPRISDQLDYEAELAVVIGSKTRFTAVKDALDGVFGYACTPPVCMKAGDTIEVNIEGIGTLVNEVTT